MDDKFRIILLVLLIAVVIGWFFIPDDINFNVFRLLPTQNSSEPVGNNEPGADLMDEKVAEDSESVSLEKDQIEDKTESKAVSLSAKEAFNLGEPYVCVTRIPASPEDTVITRYMQNGLLRINTDSAYGNHKVALFRENTEYLWDVEDPVGSLRVINNPSTFEAEFNGALRERSKNVDCSLVAPLADDLFIPPQNSNL